MRFLRVSVLLGLICIVLSGCNAGGDKSDVSKIVQATVEALTQQAGGPKPSTPAATPSNAPGSISGSLNYPADSLPPMHVVAFEVGSKNYVYVDTEPDQGTYRIDGLRPGTYHVVAYTIGGGSFPAGLAGGYTQVVPCGMTAACTDHSLIDVHVGPGQAVTGIDPRDWYAPDGTFPAFPR